MRNVHRTIGSGWLVGVLGCLFLPLGAFASPASSPVAPTASPAASADQEFFVLCYHRFLNKPIPVQQEDPSRSPTGEDPGQKGPKQTEYETSMDDFKWQMQYLKENGFTPISQEQLMGYWFQGRPLPLKPVLLTFDDGFESIYRDAFPVVQKMGFPSILFLYTDFVRNREVADRNREKKIAAKSEDPEHPKKVLSEISPQMRFDALSDAQMAEMQKAGMVIESHTTHHLNMGLVREKKGEAAFAKILWNELTEPLTYISTRFGRKPQWLAYPFGVYDPVILEATKKAGYQLAFTVNPGPNDRTIPPLLLKRNLVLWPFGREAFQRIFRDKVLHCEDLAPGDGASIDAVRPVISAKITDDVDPKSVRLQIGAHVMKLRYDPGTGAYSHAIKADLTQGGHIFCLSAVDRQGQHRVLNWYFRIKHKKLAHHPGRKGAADVL
ncbi:MAG TPA: polysaccharide deacetylase family protein [bacterium]|nr:polysaccharide deacetylase family protein [bacterium]